MAFYGAEEVNVSGIYHPFTRKCNENPQIMYHQLLINYMLPLLGFSSTNKDRDER